MHGGASELGETDGSFGSSGGKDADRLDSGGRRLGSQLKEGSGSSSQGRFVFGTIIMHMALVISV